MRKDVHIDEKEKPRLRGVEAHGAFICQARRLLGLTQEALATAANCDVRTIRRAENNGRLDIATLVRMASALRAPYEKIVKSKPRRHSGQHE